MDYRWREVLDRLSYRERMRGLRKQAASTDWKGGSWAAWVEGVQKWRWPRYRSPKVEPVLRKEANGGGSAERRHFPTHIL